MTRNALIVVDMLVDFIDRDGALYCGQTAEKIVPRIRGKIEQAREAGDMVIYLADSHRPDDKEFEMFPRHCVKGTPGADVISELRPRRGDRIVRKPSLSGFYRTRLESILKEKKIRSVEVVGVCTSICVMDTVGGLSYRGYPTTVDRKAVADFDQKFHRFALQRMEKTYGAKIV
jgi:nicotinamidase-related amidase